MKKSLKAICIGASLLSCSGMFAQTVKDIVSPFVYDSIELNGNCKLMHESGDTDFHLIPDCKYKEDCENTRVVKNEKKNVPFIGEMLFKIDKADLKNSSNTGKEDFDITDVSNILTSISKMQGMTYYSNTRGKRAVLYDVAYRVESEENPVRIDDNNSGQSDGQVIYAYMKDSLLGACKYKLSYHQNKNELYLRFVNLDTMGVGPIRALQPGNLILNVIAVDCGDSFIMYLGTDVDCIKFPGVRGTLENSLVARLEAMYDWFVLQF